MASTESNGDRHVGLFRRKRNEFAVCVHADGFVRVFLDTAADGGADDTQGSVG